MGFLSCQWSNISDQNRGGISDVKYQTVSEGTSYNFLVRNGTGVNDVVYKSVKVPYTAAQNAQRAYDEIRTKCPKNSSGDYVWSMGSEGINGTFPQSMSASTNNLSVSGDTVHLGYKGGRSGLSLAFNAIGFTNTSMTAWLNGLKTVTLFYSYKEEFPQQVLKTGVGTKTTIIAEFIPIKKSYIYVAADFTYVSA